MFRDPKLLLISLFLFLAGCSIDANITRNLMPIDLPTGVVLPSVPISGVAKDNQESDFAHSQTAVGQHGIADGTSILRVVIRLINSDDTLVIAYQPRYEVATGTGVLVGSCTVSDNYGVSICNVRATEPGLKTLEFKFPSAGTSKSLDVVFNSPVKETTVIGDGGEVIEATDPKGWRMSGAVGTSYDRVISSKSGWKMYIGSAAAVID